MSNFDPYKVLGLSPEASRKDIEVSFHRLLRQVPPPTPEEKRALENAYCLLANPDRRAVFDRRRGYTIHPAFNQGNRWEAEEYFQFGLRAMEKGNLKKAGRAFRKALLLWPWEPTYRSYLGLALALAGGDLHRARDLCQSALRLEPGNEVCRRNLAMMYRQAGLILMAEKTLSRKPETYS